MQGLERSIAEVNEVFRDLGAIVSEQQFLVGKYPLTSDNIEANVNSVTVNLEGATGELRQASNYQNAAGKKYFWIFVIILIVTLIVVLSLQPWSLGRR